MNSAGRVLLEQLNAGDRIGNKADRPGHEVDSIRAPLRAPMIMLPRRPLSIILMTALVISAPVPAVAGSWKLEFDSRELPSVSYMEDGKTVFLLGCGRAFGLHAKYPGTPGKSGKASLSIGSPRSRMTLVGEFEETDGGDLTTFVQWDLGFSRQDPELFGKRWDRLLSRLLSLIERADPLVISTARSEYRLPRVDAPGWRSAIEKCGGK